MCHRLNKKAYEFEVRCTKKKCQHKEVPWQLQHVYREGCLKSPLYLRSFACDLRCASHQLSVSWEGAADVLTTVLATLVIYTD